MIQTVTAIQRQAQNTAATGASRSDFGALLGAPTDLDVIFEQAASRYGVDVNLLKAVAKAESDFDPSAVSGCGAMGVMQLMPGTARELGVSDPFDPRENIFGGAKYLSQQLERFGGDVTLALAAYNAGPGAVSRYGGVPPYAETEAYVEKVTALMGQSLTAGTVTQTNGRLGSTGLADSAIRSAQAATPGVAVLMREQLFLQSLLRSTAMGLTNGREAQVRARAIDHVDAAFGGYFGGWVADEIAD
jgi:hypothetical protein